MDSELISLLNKQKELDLKIQSKLKNLLTEKVDFDKLKESYQAEKDKFFILKDDIFDSIRKPNSKDRDSVVQKIKDLYNSIERIENFKECIDYYEFLFNQLKN